MADKENPWLNPVHPPKTSRFRLFRKEAAWSTTGAVIAVASPVPVGAVVGGVIRRRYGEKRHASPAFHGEGKEGS